MKSGSGSEKIATISNTIKTTNLPIYTVCRKEAKNTPLIVTLTWVVSGSSGSNKPTTYNIAPKIMPYIKHYKFKGSSDNGKNRSRGIINNKLQGTCNSPLNTNFSEIAADFFSFKFIDANDDAIENTETTANKINVTIPAGSQGTIFRLDPHRCPDKTSITSKDKTMSSIRGTQASRVRGGASDETSKVSIEITGTDDDNLSLDDTMMKELSIEYKHVDSTTVLSTSLETSFGEALKDVFIKYFLYEDSALTPSTKSMEANILDSSTKDHLYDLDPDTSTDEGDEIITNYKLALEEADTLAGEYGSDN